MRQLLQVVVVVWPRLGKGLVCSIARCAGREAHYGVHCSWLLFAHQRWAQMCARAATASTVARKQPVGHQAPPIPRSSNCLPPRNAIECFNASGKLVGGTATRRFVATSTCLRSVRRSQVLKSRLDLHIAPCVPARRAPLLQAAELSAPLVRRRSHPSPRITRLPPARQSLKPPPRPSLAGCAGLKIVTCRRSARSLAWLRPKPNQTQQR